MSASEAARLVGFRSRNSMFRILAGDTSFEVDSRFLQSLRQAIGDGWPAECWAELETALEIKRVGLEQYQSDLAFRRAMFEQKPRQEYYVETKWRGGEEKLPLQVLLKMLAEDARLEVMITGNCSRDVSLLLVQALGEHGDRDRVHIRHYLDVSGRQVVHDILGVLPLLSKVWYNARLVDEERCPPQMAALYRVSVISIMQLRNDGSCVWHELLQYDDANYVHRFASEDEGQVQLLLDRYRLKLELLKPLAKLDGVEAFSNYTAQYEWLERDGMILSVKPDVHFNCIPSRILYQSIRDGFEQAGLASGDELMSLMAQLQEIHDARYENMRRKHRPTHLVFSLPAMKRFMQTGVLTDQFFIQRAYTPQERREIIRDLWQQAQENPFFQIHFLRDEEKELRNEMTFYENKGVLLLDAYTGYDLYEDHSEALITLPAFVESFHKFFMEQLLTRMVMPQAEGLAELEKLYLEMEV